MRARDASLERAIIAETHLEETIALLVDVLTRRFAGTAALVSSFGAESAVLLHLVAEIDRTVPIISLDTGMLFAETLRYRDRLLDRLGFADVRMVKPDPDDFREDGADEPLWRRDPDLCCRLRKVLPLKRALAGFAAWLNGRKQYQGHARAELSLIEELEGLTKINPLARWSMTDIDDYFQAHALPRHPLWDEGFASIGCWPCSSPAGPGEGTRDGRWRGRNKTECGIHLPWPRQSSRDE